MRKRHRQRPRLGRGGAARRRRWRSSPRAAAAAAVGVGDERHDDLPTLDRQGRGQAQPDRVGGLLLGPVVREAVREADRLQDPSQVRGLVERDGHADARGGGGGGGQYDMVSASGDASLRLIYGGDVQPVNVNLIPSWKNFIPTFKSPAHNTVNGVHYGISLQWGPNMLLYNTDKVKPGADELERALRPEVQGQDHGPEQPDPDRRRGALPDARRKPDLGITDPYELNKKQFDATVNLLKQQQPLVKKYWDYASDEIDLFKNGDVVDRRGLAVPDASRCRRRRCRSRRSSRPRARPAGPTRGCSPTKAPHPNCAYMWMKYVSHAAGPGAAGARLRRDARSTRRRARS